MKEKLLQYIEECLHKADAENWFPDDDSLREGYKIALQEMKELIQELSEVTE